jgi:hypothetical protein
MLWSAEELPEASSAAGKDFKSLRFPLWTQNKARLIQTYLRLFVYITHHGTYIEWHPRSSPEAADGSAAFRQPASGGSCGYRGQAEEAVD